MGFKNSVLVSSSMAQLSISRYSRATVHVANSCSMEARNFSVGHQSNAYDLEAISNVLEIENIPSAVLVWFA